MPLAHSTRHWIIGALIFSTLIKLYLALFTHGTTDVDAFIDHLAKVRQFGVQAYHHRGVFDNPFNSPPPMIHVIKALGFLADHTSIDFGFWLRLLPIVGSVGTFFLTWHFLRNRKDVFPLLLALALCPISIMVDGYHGNTDGLMIMFVLLSIYFIDRRKYIPAGLALGLACCIKVVPLMFVPAIVLFLQTTRSRVKVLITAVTVFGLASMPYILQDPVAVKNGVFGYASIYGSWGIPQMAAILSNVQYVHPPFEPLGVHAIIALGLKYLTVALILVFSVWMNYRHSRPSLLMQFGIVIALVLFFAPGFGPQYLVWMVPFILPFGLKSTLTYYIPASLFLAYKYSGLVDRAQLVPVGFVVALFCWLSLALLMVSAHQQLNQPRNFR